MRPQQLISVALCTYNGARYLHEQIDSILQQTYKNVEIVVVDDCSTDNTYPILEQYAGKFSHIRLYQNPENLGYIKNFEKAVKLCSGTLVALADQDDIWKAEKLELQANFIKNNLLIYHNSEFINQDGSLMGRTMAGIRNFYRGNDNRVFLVENCVSGHSCLFKKELIDYLLPFPENVFHDWWLAYIAASYGSIDYLDECLVFYRQHNAANTDILRANRLGKRDPLIHIQKEAGRVTRFSAAAPEKTDIGLFSRLLNERLKRYFCFSLFLFLLKKQHVILYIPKKSAISKLNFSLKYLWGYKLKSMLNT